MENNNTKKSKKILAEPWWMSSDIEPTQTPAPSIRYDNLSQQEEAANSPHTEREKQIQEEKERQEQRKKLAAEVVPVIKASTEKKKLTLFRNKNDVLQAIVMKEILDPPKSI